MARGLGVDPNDIPPGDSADGLDDIDDLFSEAEGGPSEASPPSRDEVDIENLAIRIKASRGKRDPLQETQREAHKLRGVDLKILREELKKLQGFEDISDVAERAQLRRGYDENPSDPQFADRRSRIADLKEEIKRRPKSESVALREKPFGGPVKVRKVTRQGPKRAAEGLLTEFGREQDGLGAGGPDLGSSTPLGSVSFASDGGGGGIGGGGIGGGGASSAAFQPYSRVVDAPGGLSILGVLQNDQGETGFRVQWGEETIDWFPQGEGTKPQKGAFDIF